jgi:hypothetical protein
MTEQNTQIDIEDYIAEKEKENMRDLSKIINQNVDEGVLRDYANEAPSISSAAMIVDFNASVWTARKKDMKASDDIAAMNGADVGIADVRKKLLGNCDELIAVQKFSANVRNIHYSMTLPWSDNGSRLLTTQQYFKYNEVMSQLQTEFHVLVDNFLQAYQWEVSKAQAKLGAMFNRDEYPTSDAIRDKFRFRVSYEELPDGGNTGDWRLDLPHEAMQTLRTNYANSFDLKINSAMSNLWHKLHDNLVTLVRQLDVNEEGKGNRLYDTVFDRAIELVSMLGTCNVTKDSQMEAMRRKLEDAFYGLNLDQIKNSPSLREDTRSKLTAAIAALPSLDM